MNNFIEICVICEKSFIQEKQYKSDKKRKTCSPECLKELRGRVQRRKIKTQCSHCGKSLEKIPAHMKYKNHFCDKLCLGKYYRGKKRGGRKKGLRCSKETEFKKGDHSNLKGEFKPGNQDQKDRWLNDDYMFKFFRGVLFGKNHTLNDLDKKVIKTKILISKIKRRVKNNGNQQEIRGAGKSELRNRQIDL